LYYSNSQLSIVCHFTVQMQSGCCYYWPRRTALCSALLCSALLSHNPLTHVAASSRGTLLHAVGCCFTDSCRRPSGTQNHNYLRVWTVKDTNFQCSVHDVLERKGTQNGEAISVSARMDVTELQLINPLRRSGYLPYRPLRLHSHNSVRRFPCTQITDSFL
jgi:hypothetical protein